MQRIGRADMERLPADVQARVREFHGWNVEEDCTYVSDGALSVADVSDYLNHAPAGAANVAVVHGDEPWVTFVTTRDIAAGEELLFDYTHLLPFVFPFVTDGAPSAAAE